MTRKEPTVRMPATALPLVAIQEIAETEYGIAAQASRLPGESDQNFLLTEPGGRRSVMKVVHPDEPAANTRFQTELLMWLADNCPLATPEIVPTVDGRLTTAMPSALGSTVRVIGFVPGAPARTLPLSTATCGAFGRGLADLHVGLQSFAGDIPPLEVEFDLASMAAIHLLESTPQLPKRALIERVLTTHVREVLPVLRSLPLQLIHNDFNLDNVMVEANPPRVVGAFDFGDVVVGPRIADIAVTSAYVFDASDPSTLTASLRSMVSGYETRSSLTGDELRLLPDLIAARLSIALVLTHARAADATERGHRAYVLRNAERSLARLKAVTAESSTTLVRDLTVHQ